MHFHHFAANDFIRGGKTFKESHQAFASCTTSELKISRAASFKYAMQSTSCGLGRKFGSKTKFEVLIVELGLGLGLGSSFRYASDQSRSSRLRREFVLIVELGL